MNGMISVLVMSVALAAIAAAVPGCIVIANARSRREELPAACRPRPGRDQTETQSLLWIHSAPAVPFTVPQARRAMQMHRDCSLTECPRRAHAHETLAASGILRISVGAR